MNVTEATPASVVSLGLSEVNGARPLPRGRSRTARRPHAPAFEPRRADAPVRARPGPRAAAAAGPVCAADFEGELQREMRRAERGGQALSLVVYEIADGTRANPSAERLLARVCSRKREIDTVGVLDAGRIAVLCPGTDARGTEGFTRKIAALDDAAAARRVSVATYPDALFDDLCAGLAPSANCRPFVEFDAAPPGAATYRLKRAIDVVGALVGLVFAAPVMAAVAVGIALTSPGPVVFRQTRLGRAGKPFTFYKFRSMTIEAEDRPHREFVARLIRGVPAPDGAAAAPYKLHADPRVTRFGRFIRRTSIDELPQFFNVLKGEMSLVGPRPPIPYEATHYEAWHLRRILSITPGITGLWQVQGRSRVPFDEMVRMDLRYQRECSLRLDLKILLRTLLVVTRCDGAV